MKAMKFKKYARRSHGDSVNGEPGPPVEEERGVEVPIEFVALMIVFALALLGILAYCAQPASKPYAMPRTDRGTAVARLAEPAPSPTTPSAWGRHRAMNPAPAGTVIAVDPPLGTCKRMKTEDPDAYHRLYTGSAAGAGDMFAWGDTYDPNAFNYRAPAWIEECQTAVPGVAAQPAGMQAWLAKITKGRA